MLLILQAPPVLVIIYMLPGPEQRVGEFIFIVLLFNNVPRDIFWIAAVTPDCIRVTHTLSSRSTDPRDATTFTVTPCEISRYHSGTHPGISSP